MMNKLAFVVALFSALPAAAQTGKVYTNDDLSTGSVRWSRTVTTEELASLKAREFKLPAQYDGPTVIYVSTAVEPQPLPPYRPLSEPFITPNYLPYGYGYGYARRVRSTDRVSERSQASADSISHHQAPARPVNLPAAAGGVRVKR